MSDLLFSTLLHFASLRDLRFGRIANIVLRWQRPSQQVKMLTTGQMQFIQRETLRERFTFIYLRLLFFLSIK